MASGILSMTLAPIATKEVRMGDNKILRNMAECAQCHDFVESTHVHDFQQCSCGAIAVDGGHEYLRRSAKDFDNLIDRSIVE